LALQRYQQKSSHQAAETWFSSRAAWQEFLQAAEEEE